MSFDLLLPSIKKYTDFMNDTIPNVYYAVKGFNGNSILPISTTTKDYLALSSISVALYDSNKNLVWQVGRGDINANADGFLLALLVRNNKVYVCAYDNGTTPYTLFFAEIDLATGAILNTVSTSAVNSPSNNYGYYLFIRENNGLIEFYYRNDIYTVDFVNLTVSTSTKPGYYYNSYINPNNIQLSGFTNAMYYASTYVRETEQPVAIINDLNDGSVVRVPFNSLVQFYIGSGFNGAQYYNQDLGILSLSGLGVFKTSDLDQWLDRVVQKYKLTL